MPWFCGQNQGILLYWSYLKERCDPMKKINLFLAVMLCLVMLTACGGGDVRNVKRETGTSERYSDAQIHSAMNEVLDFFEKEFDGCTMTQIRYDEEKFAERQNMTAERLSIFFGDTAAFLPDL